MSHTSSSGNAADLLSRFHNQQAKHDENLVERTLTSILLNSHSLGMRYWTEYMRCGPMLAEKANSCRLQDDMDDLKEKIQELETQLLSLQISNTVSEHSMMLTSPTDYNPAVSSAHLLASPAKVTYSCKPSRKLGKNADFRNHVLKPEVRPDHWSLHMWQALLGWHKNPMSVPNAIRDDPNGYFLKEDIDVAAWLNKIITDNSHLAFMHRMKTVFSSHLTFETIFSEFNSNSLRPAFQQMHWITDSSMPVRMGSQITKGTKDKVQTTESEKFDVLDEAEKEHWREQAASLKAELEAARETFTSEAVYKHFTTMFEFWGQCEWYFHIIAASSPVEGQAKSWCLTHSNGYKFLSYDIHCQNYKEHVTDEWHHFVNTCYTEQMSTTLQTECFLQNGQDGYPLLPNLSDDWSSVQIRQILTAYFDLLWEDVTCIRVPWSDVSETPEKYLNISIFPPELLPLHEPKDYTQIQLFQLWALILSTQSESSDILPLCFTKTIKGHSVPNVTWSAPIPNVTAKKKKIADQFYVDECARHLTSRSEHTPSSPSARSSSSDITPSDDNMDNAVTMDVSDTMQSLIYADKAEDVNQAPAVDGQIQPKLVTTNKTAGPPSSLTLLSDTEQPTDIMKNKCKRAAKEDSVEQVVSKKSKLNNDGVVKGT
ncbi:hypothetical protein M422DRAFT_256512 [Sphaerobolus stellatus SS14]|uniref:Uncharacterized protein n=1 Tax=Sphaerobolus stellatus (strain SS14) TaxID=990650 RepID=A0A0C9VGI1_SPHS4|nr:hypothetical protein M422DRAFT_256512 [Sphaerobolus stellatus SS14]